MRTYLAVVGDGSATAVLETAVRVLDRCGGHLTGLNALSTEPAVVFGGEMGFSLSAELDQTLAQEGQQRRAAAHALFTATMARHGIPLGPPADHPTAAWREESSRQNAAVGLLGRLFDLIVVERPLKPGTLAAATLEDALFESGHPVLMAPPMALPTLGERMMIAWNGSAETARTIACATPFLERAQSIDVVSIEGGMLGGPSGEVLAAALAAKRLPATARHLPKRSMSPGEAFLAEAKTIGADLLVKGAYTQSRLRQMIFGGATQHIILHADLPVILAH